jgi:hypothetical protein
MEERRGKQRARSLKGAKISLQNQAVVYDCQVRNFSVRGACLEVASPVGIPEKFDLILNADGETIPCRTVWRKARRIGIEFDIAR